MTLPLRRPQSSELPGSGLPSNRNKECVMLCEAKSGQQPSDLFSGGGRLKGFVGPRATAQACAQSPNTVYEHKSDVEMSVCLRTASMRSLSPTPLARCIEFTVRNNIISVLSSSSSEFTFVGPRRELRDCHGDGRVHCEGSVTTRL
jgi:hypothetical protein